MKRFILLLVLLTLTLTILSACKDAETGEELTCPECGSTDIVPIAYGLPGQELVEAADRGEVILGGCIVWDNAPNLHCKACGTQWYKPTNTEIE